MAASNRAWRQYVPRHSLFHERVKTDPKKEEKNKTKTKRQHCTRLSVPAALVVVLRHEHGDIYCRPYRERRELRAITDIYLTGIEGLVLAFQRERGRIFCILFLFPTTTTTTRKKERKKEEGRLESGYEMFSLERQQGQQPAGGRRRSYNSFYRLLKRPICPKG